LNTQILNKSILIFLSNALKAFVNISYKLRAKLDDIDIYAFFLD